MEIAILRRQGKSIRTIARLMGISVNTVQKYLKEGKVSRYPKRNHKPTKLAPYQSYIRERLQLAAPYWIPATVILREIEAQGYLGKIRQLQSFMETLKPLDRLLPVVRFETEPGRQMQVDWAHFYYHQVKLYAFIATLGYSRASYVEFTQQMTLSQLLHCHVNAFDYFQGVPMEILYDNMKTIVIERNAYGAGQHRLHSGLADFAKHYGFVPRLCQPYRAQTKGKVERFIRYLRESFFIPLITTLKSAQLHLDIQVANTGLWPIKRRVLADLRGFPVSRA